MDFNRRKIGGKWKPLIMFVLSSQPQRFNKIKQLLPGISGNMLSRCLKEMEENGLVMRNPPKYALTSNAEKIVRLLGEIRIIVELLP
jgi:DNA-binding HxlR family transcriptional regulator